MKKWRTSMKDFLKNTALIIIGSFIVGLSINVFFVPSHLLGGGITAIAILINAETGFNIALFTLLANIPIFIAAYVLVDRKFFINSLIGMISMTIALRLTEWVPVISNNLITCVIAGGVMGGIGGGMVLRQNGSDGGSDIILRILYKYFSISMGITNLLINAVILSVSAYFLGIDLVVASIASIYISSKVLNYIVEGLNYKRSITIVATNADEISDALIKEFEKGVTILEGKGGYSGEIKKIIMCTINPYQTPKLRAIVLKIEPTAFITITESSSVIGGGFKDKSLE
jgi:uncharacterized membrane-anchored protein YitT (DUF2179 family)